jgi:hypothetical protein
MAEFPTNKQEMWDRMLDMDGAAIDLSIEREVLQAHRTFSEVAMDQLVQQMATWVGTRVMRRWASTQEPPSALRVSLHVEVG